MIGVEEASASIESPGRWCAWTSLLIPDLPEFVWIDLSSNASQAVGRNVHDLKAPFHLVLDKLRSPFETLIRVLVKDGTMMFLRILAALDHENDKVEKLRIGVVGIVNVCK